MISRTYNAQFLTLDFRLLDDPGFCAFMRSPCFALYLLLRRYVWRDVRTRHPLAKVNELFKQGYLVCAVPRDKLAAKLGVREPSHISRYLAELVSLGFISKLRTGRLNVYVLGFWEDLSLARDGRYVQETFYLEQRHGADRPAPLADVSSHDTSDVSSHDTSDVSESTHNNREENKKKNPKVFSSDPDPERRDRPFEPVDKKERVDDVLYVED